MATTFVDKPSDRDDIARATEKDFADEDPFRQASGSELTAIAKPDRGP